MNCVRAKCVLIITKNALISFCRDIPQGKPTAKYQGHLVHEDGTLAKLCPLTSILFFTHSQLGLIKFSKSHCLSVWSRRSNLKIDGSHHATTAFDKSPDRGNLPWGACVNSSQDTGNYILPSFPAYTRACTMRTPAHALCLSHRS